ncbi:MAG: type II secretion system minor pseudopilin GspI [Oceanococcaceae bacterium]
MNASRGFTLIEVLAALAVLALAMTASLSASTFFASTTRDLEDRMLAGWLAHNVMVETQLELQWPQVDSRDDDWQFASYDWVVERTVEATPDDYIRRVTVRVRRERDDDDAWLLSRAAFFAEPAPPLPPGALSAGGASNPVPSGTGGTSAGP